MDLTADAFEKGVDDIVSAIADAIDFVENTDISLEVEGGTHYANGSLNGALNVTVTINTGDKTVVSASINDKGFIDAVNKGLQMADDVTVAASTVVSKTEAVVQKLLKYLVNTTMQLANLAEEDFQNGITDVADAIAR